MRANSSKTTNSSKNISEPALTKKKTSVKKMPLVKKLSLEDNQRREMIREAAYYLAEKCEFNPVMTEQNWLLAEKQIDQI